MSDADTRFHKLWLGSVQPIDGLVLSIPVLVDAGCTERQSPEVHERFRTLLEPIEEDDARIQDLDRFLSDLLALTPDLFDAATALPEDLSLYVPEGRQTIRPTLALKRRDPEPTPDSKTDDSTPASRAGANYLALVWDVPDGLPLDKPETATGPWEYPAAAKFDRLLRHTRVPIGLLTNRRELRLVYAPHGESSGHIAFRFRHMTRVDGRPIVDAFVTLLSATRFFGVAPEHRLPALLAESRTRQANVTNELADQVFEALEALLLGFEGAAERDGSTALRDALERGDDHLYGGLLTVLMRLVFVLYAEDRGLLPVDDDFYSENLSALGLYDELERDHGAFPDSMARRYGAWGRLTALFRAIFLGAEHGELAMPARRGQLFDPNEYPFLEGWGPSGSAPIKENEDRAAVRVPTLDDATVFRVLQKLIVFQGQRLSYRTLDVEQIGSVYEALMGYHVVRLDSPAVCLRPNRVWVTADEVKAERPAQRAKWLKETTGLSKAQAEKLSRAITDAGDDDTILLALEDFRAKHTERARAGRLVVQPGPERRRTSSHYTPRSLSAPIVRRTLEPLLACMGETPTSDLLLNLKICDPAMGSGAFLVEACRFLGDQLVAAWTRENKIELIADAHDDVVNHARRLVAQRCLYGVDKNPYAVNLAKLSLWLVTLAKNEPFTFLDHALRHGDSLVGLDFDQIKSFHWKPGKQLELCKTELEAALAEAIDLRQRIGELAGDSDPTSQREKERLLWDAEDALSRARLIADLVVGAFFAEQKAKARDKERTKRLDRVVKWLEEGGPPPEDLRAMQTEIRARIPVFHWMLEFPEVFYAERPDPLEGGKVNRAAFMDAFLGNPPFAGKNAITRQAGSGYIDWLMATHADVKGRPNTDLCAYFFRRAFSNVGHHGSIGLVATNTIAQGDSRLVSLKRIVEAGGAIYAATRSTPWPGAASVFVSIVHLAVGRVAQCVKTPVLDEISVAAINSRLRPRLERPDPVALASNRQCNFTGGKLVGIGLAVGEAEYASLIATDPRNAEVLRPFLGGEEVNSRADASHERFMIDFSDKTLDEAGAWPTLLRIVEERVRPARERDKRGTYKTYWWRPGESGRALYSALAGHERCLVTAVVTKHLMFSFQPTSRFFSHKLYVFPLQHYAPFAILQSRVHESWTRLLSSTLEDRLNYSGSDCFETFPFPHSDPRAVITRPEAIGASVYNARAEYMIATNHGLTQTYNLLKNPDCNDDAIETLRRLHEEMDRTVLDAYGWTDIQVPRYTTPRTDAEKKALETFEDEVIDRLFLLNAQRAEAEAKQGTATKRGKRARAKQRPGARVSAAVPTQTGIDFKSSE